jgi:stage II sporulation protein B
MAMNKARITYRFNRNDEHHQNKDEKQQKTGVVVPLHQDIGNSEKGNTAPSSIDGETGYVDANPSWKLNQENGGLKSSWKDFEDLGPIYDERITSTSYIRRRGAAPWFKIITSAGGAIITGILFGAFVLSLFAGNENLLDAVSPTPSAEQTTEAAGETPEAIEEKIMQNTENMGVTSGPAGLIQVDIPGKSYFVLQNGMFSDTDGVEQAIETLQSSGFAGVSEQRENYYVYAGISNSRDDALSLSHHLQENGLETYIKTLEIPAVNSIHWAGETSDDFESYIAEGDRLVEILGNLSALHLSKSEAASLDNAAVETLKSTHQNWTQLNASISKGLPEDSLAGHQSMITAMNTALLSMEEYQKNPSHSYLWQAQKSVMQYVITEKQLLASLSSKAAQ